MPRSIFVASLFALAGTSAAFAIEGAALNDLAACRLDAQQVSLSFSFDGSACVADEPAQLGNADPATLAVTIPLKATSDVCTMSIVPVKISQTLAADENIAAMQIAVLDPQGNAIAAGETAIAPAGEGCAKDVSAVK